MIMYGKLFVRLYQGSMVGAGSHVFAVWGYCIANADPENHTVDLNPALLATIIGEAPERIEAAIKFLCSPDPHSHCPDYEGARLVHRGGLEYFLVTHEDYRDMQNNEELRAYFREAQRKYRMSKTVKDSIETPVSVSASDKGGHGGKPTREESSAYAKEIGFEGWESWYDHFESNGWKVSGKTPMKDWKAAMRNGKRMQFSGTRKNKQVIL